MQENPRLRRTPRQRGFSLIELLIVIAIILTIVAIAVPQANKLMMNAHETAAIGEIQTLHKAQVQYYSQFGRYAQSLAELGPPASGAAGPSAAELIPKVLADGKKSGYIFTVAGGTGGYTISAVPEQWNTTGRRTFFSDQSLQIHQNWTAEPATIQSPDFK